MQQLIYGGSGIHQNPTVIEQDLLALALLGELATAKVMLIKNTGLAYPVKDVVVGDLEEADFDGYALSAAVVWGAPFHDVNGNVMSTAQKLQFLCTGSTTPNSVTGAALVKADKSEVYAVDLFLDENGDPAPVTMDDNGDALDYVPATSFFDRDNQ